MEYKEKKDDNWICFVCKKEFNIHKEEPCGYYEDYCKNCKTKHNIKEIIETQEIVINKGTSNGK